MKKKDKHIDEDGNTVPKPKSKPKSKKKPSTRKKRISARLKKLALRYEAAWKTVFGAADPWKRRVIDEEPSGRHAKELYHEAAMLAESEGFEPKRAIYAGKDGPASDDIFPEMITGKQFPDDNDENPF